MKILLFLFTLFCSTLSISQIVFDKTKHDFGEINSNEPRFVDVYLKNQTGKDVFILSVKKPMEVVYIQRNALIAPDSLSVRSEEHTSELQSRPHLVCRLLLEKKKKKTNRNVLNNIKH